MENNPLLEQENHFAGYQKSIQELKNNPNIIAFDRLCYEVFEATEMGREFLKIARERFLYGTQVSRGNPTYQIDVLWQEGFRDAFRLLITAVTSHQQRILAETK